MKLVSLLVLPPAFAAAFAPPTHPVAFYATRSSSTVVLRDALDVDSAVKDIEDNVEKYAGKADDLVLNRAMRLANHAPILVTLKALADKAGMSAGLAGVTSNPGAFAGLGTALSVPTWCYNVWAIAALSQLASVAKSALASNGDELSQASITATAVSNWAATRMIGSANPLRDTVLTALISSYALRNDSSASGDLTLHNASTQLVASFTATLAVLGTVSAAIGRLAFLDGVPELGTLLGVAAMYVISKREGNGTLKNTVNGGILAGMLYNRVVGGLSFALTGASIMNTVALFGLASVTAEAVNNVRKAVFN